MYARYSDRNKAFTACLRGYEGVHSEDLFREGVVTMSADTTDTEELSPDLVFDILSNTRRRMVLYYLRQYGGSATVQELAREIAALENDVTVEELTRQQQKRVYVSLYQTHLPKLEETGIVESDESGSVYLTDRAGEIDGYLQSATEEGYSWQRHYLALAAVGALLFVLAEAGVPGIAAVPTVALGVLIMAAFAVSSAVQYWQHTRQQNELPPELLKHDD